MQKKKSEGHFKMFPIKTTSFYFPVFDKEWHKSQERIQARAEEFNQSGNNFFMFDRIIAGKSKEEMKYLRERAGKFEFGSENFSTVANAIRDFQGENLPSRKKGALAKIEDEELQRKGGKGKKAGIFFISQVLTTKQAKSTAQETQGFVKSFQYRHSGVVVILRDPVHVVFFEPYKADVLSTKTAPKIVGEIAKKYSSKINKVQLIHGQQTEKDENCVALCLDFVEKHFGSEESEEIPAATKFVPIK